MKGFAHRFQSLSNYQFIVFMLVSVVLSVIVVTATITSAEAGKISRTPDEKLEFVQSQAAKFTTGTEPQRPTDRLVPAGFDCARVREKGLDKQQNMRAGAIMTFCGEAQGRSTLAFLQISKKLLSPMMFGTTDVDLITGTETSPNITQSTTYSAANPDNPNQIVVGYDDSRGRSAIPINIGGASVSLDGGSTITRLTRANGQSPFDFTFGDPVVLYNKPSGTWFTIWLDSSCGGEGLGGYKSTTPADPNSWSHFCFHVNNADDKESGWAENKPSSPFYGRLYVSWNDFNVGAGALMATFSTDNGVTWATPRTVSNTATFIRSVQMTGDMAGNGTVYIAGMDEGGGGFPHNDKNVIFKSTDGGNTWSNPYTGPSFPGPGVTAVGYFACMFPDGGGYWRHEGWGQPAAYNNVVHLVYAQHGASTDPGDVYYIRSTDGGVTFGAPLKLNTDATARPQWEPNLSVSPSGTLLATWYDARESSSCTRGNPAVPCYRMWSRKSTDNGATWLADDTLSDVVSPLPAQPDSGLSPIYVSDYDYGSAIAGKHLTSWVDGRIAIAGVSQQDAFFDRVPTASPPSINKQFGATAIPLNGTTSLTFTIHNPNTGASLTGIGFTDNLPSGLVIAQTPNLNNTCGGTPTAVGGSGSVSLSAATLAANASCTVSVDVQGTTAGVKANSVQVTSTEGGTGNTSNASITVVSPPVISKAFGAASIPLNGSTSLQFTIANTNTTTTLTGVGFNDVLPAGLVVSTPNGLTGSCGGGTITATQNTSVINLSGASIAASGQCTFKVNVTGTTASTKNNTTGNVTSNEGGTGGTASASVTVCSVPTITCPGGISKFTDSGQLGATINPGTPVTSGGCNPVTVTGVRNDGKPLNALYPIGVTLITWTAKDVNNTSASCVQSIVVMPPSGERRHPDEEEALMVEALRFLISCVASSW